jgi:hypothetical protein
VTASEDERIRLLQAAEHVRAAIHILDKVGAPHDIAAHLDLAAERLVEVTGDGSPSTDGVNDDPEPRMAQTR